MEKDQVLHAQVEGSTEVSDVVGQELEVCFHTSDFNESGFRVYPKSEYKV